MYILTAQRTCPPCVKPLVLFVFAGHVDSRCVNCISIYCARLPCFSSFVYPVSCFILQRVLVIICDRKSMLIFNVFLCITLASAFLPCCCRTVAQFEMDDRRLVSVLLSHSSHTPYTCNHCIWFTHYLPSFQSYLTLAYEGRLGRVGGGVGLGRFAC